MQIARSDRDGVPPPRGVARSEADEAEAAKGILEFLSTQTESVEENAIHEAVEARRVVKQRSLRGLVSDGKVRRTGTGRKGDKYRYQNAGTQVPDIYGVRENQNPKNAVSDRQQSPNAGTGLFIASTEGGQPPVPAFSGADREEFEL